MPTFVPSFMETHTCNIALNTQRFLLLLYCCIMTMRITQTCRTQISNGLLTIDPAQK